MRSIQTMILLAASCILQPTNPLQQADPKTDKLQNRNSFELVMTGLTNRWSAIRYNPSTGKSFLFSSESWVPIKEAKDFDSNRRSKYTVQVTAFGTSNEFAAIRMDKKTGESWFLRDQRWVPIPEFNE
ncbi:MAG: hypothetical protein AAGG44_19560 [Planctomycetota bacterium]